MHHAGSVLPAWNERSTDERFETAVCLSSAEELSSADELSTGLLGKERGRFATLPA